MNPFEVWLIIMLLLCGATSGGCLLSCLQRESFLNYLNDLRKSVGASNMKALNYNFRLEKKARYIAMTCGRAGRNPRHMGVMIYTSFFPLSVIEVIRQLKQGQHDFIINKTHWKCLRGRKTFCENYIQVLLASINSISCYVDLCRGNNFLVCIFNKKPKKYRANVWAPPFEKGEACSECPSSNKCGVLDHNKNLCVKRQIHKTQCI